MSATFKICYNALRHSRTLWGFISPVYREELIMSRALNPKIWYLVGIGAAALAIDSLRRWVKKQQLEAESAPPAYQSFDTPERPHAPASATRSWIELKPGVEPTTPPKPAVMPAPSAKKPAKTGADDLTEIKGIGPTYAKRLVAAGITTFADLAAASPDYLREVTKATAMADPQDWIDQSATKK